MCAQNFRFISRAPKSKITPQLNLFLTARGE
jgi:hypothetical protein